MQRVLFAIGLLALLVVVVSAQPLPVPPPVAPPVVPPPAPGEPMPPMPPAPFPGAGVPVPTPPVAANPTSEPLLNRFEPLTAFPAVTQFSVRGVILGSAWMARMHQPHGRFTYGYNPALRQPISGDNDLKQAQAALAMAQTAKFSGDQKYAAVASQAILALLAATKISPTDPNCRMPVQSSFLCNHVGFASMLILAIHELPNAKDTLLDDAERLCNFLRSRVKADGSLDCSEGATSAPTDSPVFNEYPGFALQALAVSNRVRPAEWKKDAVKKGVAYYHAAFRAKPQPVLAATITPAACELYLQTKLTEASTVVFEMNDWLCALQIGATDQRTPEWAGGFRVVASGQVTSAPPGTAETGLQVQSLACAYHLTRTMGDVNREAKYKPALCAAVEFLCRHQFLEANTRHFENTYRANLLMGAFHLSPADGNLHTAVTGCAVTGLLRYLSSGAEGR